MLNLSGALPPSAPLSSVIPERPFKTPVGCSPAGAYNGHIHRLLCIMQWDGARSGTRSSKEPFHAVDLTCILKLPHHRQKLVQGCAAHRMHHPKITIVTRHHEGGLGGFVEGGGSPCKATASVTALNTVVEKILEPGY